MRSPSMHYKPFGHAPCKLQGARVRSSARKRPMRIARWEL